MLFYKDLTQLWPTIKTLFYQLSKMNNKNYDLVLIRHAQSRFNQATFIQSSKLGLHHLSWIQLIENAEFNKRVTYNKLYMDPPLSQNGRKQCKHYKDQCSKIKPDLILVSPYRRSLETCNLLFGNSAPVIVDPVLAQVFRFSCDVPDLWELNKKQHLNYDFTKIQKLGDNWYFHNLAKQLQQKIANKIKQQNINEFSQKRNLLLEMLSTKQIHEVGAMLRERTNLIKNQLSEYRKKYKVIVVIAHYYTIQYLKADYFDEDGELVQYRNIKNCHPYYERLQQLLKKK